MYPPSSQDEESFSKRNGVRNHPYNKAGKHEETSNREADIGQDDLSAKDRTYGGPSPREQDSPILKGKLQNSEKEIKGILRDQDDKEYRGEEGDEEEDEAEEDEDQEEPPLLKYHRINSLPLSFFSKDPISSCTFHETVFIVASHSGLVQIMDTEFKPVRTIKAHRASVLSTFTDGEFFASASMDGTIVIGSINDEKDIAAYDFKRPMHAIALEKNFYRERTFFTGGMSGNVLLCRKNWLGQRSDLILDEDNGPIVGILQIDDLIFWMNDAGITFYQTSTRQTVFNIKKPEDAPRSDIYWPRVIFPETDKIVIAWANCVFLVRISNINSTEKKNGSASSNRSKIISSSATLSFKNVQQKEIEIEGVCKLDCLVSGVAPFKHDLYMLLIYNPPERDPETNKMVFKNPDLKLMNLQTGEVNFEEEIGLKNVKNLGLNDFNLGIHIGNKKTSYFIISAKDGVVAEELLLEDRIPWLIEHERYLDAYNISGPLYLRQKRLNLGVLHVDNLIKQDMWKEASEFLSELLSLTQDNERSSIVSENTKLKSIPSEVDDDDAYEKELTQEWENWADIYIQSNKIEYLTDILPKTTKLNISRKIYDAVLLYWVDNFEKDDKLVTLLRDLDPVSYTVEPLEEEIEKTLEINPNPRMRRCLVDLYIKAYEPRRAVLHLMKLNDPHIFDFIVDHDLLADFRSDLPKLIKGSFDEAELVGLPIEILGERLRSIVDNLVEYRHELDPGFIVDAMKKHRLDFVCFFYLEKLSCVDDFLVSAFSDERISLFCKYDRSKLLPFLISNSSYNIDYAITLCEGNDYIEELVYLLGKIGENKKAMTFIINEFEDPNKAIKFAEHQDDEETWNTLLDFSLERPAFVKALIEAGEDQSFHFDPISILERMQGQIEIVGLRNSIMKISNNHDLNLLLNQLILAMIYRKSEDAAKYYEKQKLKGIVVNFDDEPLDSLFSYYQSVILYARSSLEDPYLIAEKDLFPACKSDSLEISFQSFRHKLERLADLRKKLNFQGKKE